MSRHIYSTGTLIVKISGSHLCIPKKRNCAASLFPIQKCNVLYPNFYTHISAHCTNKKKDSVISFNLPYKKINCAMHLNWRMNLCLLKLRLVFIHRVSITYKLFHTTKRFWKKRVMKRKKCSHSWRRGRCWRRCSERRTGPVRCCAAWPRPQLWWWSRWEEPPPGSRVQSTPFGTDSSTWQE
jgi:hypothetical protein